MVDRTDNHGYNVPAEGEQNWDALLNENFRDHEVDIPLRDTAGNRSNYEPKQGALFLATDTEELFLGDGANWTRLASTGGSPTLSSIGIGGDALTVGRSSRVNSTEYFGVAAGTSGNELGGTYVDAASGDGRPFYGYAVDGTGTARHLYDPTAGANGEWRLRVGGGTRLRVDGDGVGIGTGPDPNRTVNVAESLAVDGGGGTPAMGLVGAGPGEETLLAHGVDGSFAAQTAYLDAEDRWETRVLNAGGDDGVVTLTRGGNLGVNTGSPQRTLDLRGRRGRVRAGGDSASMAVEAQGTSPTGSLEYRYRNYGSTLARQTFLPDVDTWRLSIGGDGRLSATPEFVGVNGAASLASFGDLNTFGVRADTAGTTGASFGGMFVNTTGADSKPTYNYAIDGTRVASTYFDGVTDSWNVSASGVVKFSVSSGFVGVNGATQGPPSGTQFGVRASPDRDDGFAGMQVENTDPDGLTQYAFVNDGSTTATQYYDGGTDEWAVDNYAGTGPATVLTVDADGNLFVPGDVDAGGNKNFVETVDTDDGEKEVVYTAVESGTPHTEASGVATVEDGRADVELPEHFGWVTDPGEPLTVQVTPHARRRVCPQVTERSTRRVVVEDFTDGETPEAYEVSYTVRGTRETEGEKVVVRRPDDGDGDGNRPRQAGHDGTGGNGDRPRRAGHDGTGGSGDRPRRAGHDGTGGDASPDGGRTGTPDAERGAAASADPARDADLEADGDADADRRSSAAPRRRP